MNHAALITRCHSDLTCTSQSPDLIHTFPKHAETCLHLVDEVFVFVYIVTLVMKGYLPLSKVADTPFHIRGDELCHQPHLNNIKEIFAVFVDR